MRWGWDRNGMGMGQGWDRYGPGMGQDDIDGYHADGILPR